MLRKWFRPENIDNKRRKTNTLNFMKIKMFPF